MNEKIKELIDEKDIPSLSPYAQFVLMNLGYDFFHKRIQEKLDKWEIWAIFDNKQYSLNLIYANEHPRYERKKR
jgi:hypothetical protein